MFFRRLRSLFVFTLLASVSDAVLWAGSPVQVGRNWPADQQVSLDRIDHSGWDALLKKFVDDEGFVAYGAWKASTLEIVALDRYLDALSQGSFSAWSSRKGTQAFWINAYNAVTVKGILREYPTSSIRNHTSRFFGYNIWDDLLLVVGARTVSLNQMEHEILRKTGDPRIHFGLVCASVGCPKLRSEAYTAQDVDMQLVSNARDFFADPQKFRYNASSQQIRVSPILEWFAEDFGVGLTEQMLTIAAYLPDETAMRLARSGSARVDYLDYDWSLNDQARRR